MPAEQPWPPSGFWHGPGWLRLDLPQGPLWIAALRGDGPLQAQFSLQDPDVPREAERLSGALVLRCGTRVALKGNARLSQTPDGWQVHLCEPVNPDLWLGARAELRLADARKR